MKKKKKKEQIDPVYHCTFEASIRFLRKGYTCFVTSRGMGYLKFYYQRCGIFETQFGPFMDI